MAEHVKPTTTVDPDGRSITYFTSFAYKFPEDVPAYMIPIKTWFEDVTKVIVELTDGSRSFELEILLNQFEAQIFPILGKSAPAPLVSQGYEKPTKIAYELRKKKLIAAGRYTPPEVEDPENPMPDLPDDIYVQPFPTIDQTLKEDEQNKLKEYIQEWYNGLVESELLKLTYENLEVSRELLNQLGCNDTWELVRESDGLKTYYRAEKDVATHSFKVVGVVRAETIDLFSLIYEATQFHRWFPLMRGCTQIHELTRYKKIVQSIVASVWPFSDRECLLDCGGVDDSLRGRVLINMKDLPQDHPDWFECSSKHVRCFMPHGGFMLIPISYGQTEVSFFTNVDPQLALPTSLLNLVTGKMIHTLLPTMEQWAPKTKLPDSEWLKERQLRPYLYNHVQTAIEEFFEEEIRLLRENPVLLSPASPTYQ